MPTTWTRVGWIVGSCLLLGGPPACTGSLSGRTPADQSAVNEAPSNKPNSEAQFGWTRATIAPEPSTAAVKAAAAPTTPEAIAPEFCVHAGAPLAGAPTIAPDGSVYFSTLEGRVHAFDERGGFLWTYNLEAPLSGAVGLRPDGVVLAGVRRGRLYALRPTGTLLWSFTTPSPPITGIAVDDKGNAYYGAADGAVYVVSRWARARLRLPLKARAELTPQPVGKQIVVAVEGRFLSARGFTARKERPVTGSIRQWLPGPHGEHYVIAGASLEMLSPELEPVDRWLGVRWIALRPTGALVAVTSDGRLRELTGHGARQSSLRNLEESLSAAPAMQRRNGSGARARKGKSSGIVRAPMRAGIALPEEVSAAPVVDARGRVYLGFSDGRVRSFGPEGAVAGQTVAIGPTIAALRYDEARKRVWAAASDGRVCAFPLMGARQERSDSAPARFELDSVEPRH